LYLSGWPFFYLWAHFEECRVADEIRSILEGVAAPQVALVHTIQYKNSLLDALGADVVGRLRLHPVVFELGHEIEYPGRNIEHVFFLEEGMASMTTTFEDGSQVEVGTFGYESVIGVSALMGTKRSLNRIYTQIAGSGYSSVMELARREFALGGDFQKMAMRYVQMQLVQAMQSAGCNAKHSFEQRLARWLLICADRTDSATFQMSHEFLADMLGSTRPTVTMAALHLKDAGLIRYTRGAIEILDEAGLERVACECYRVVRDHLEDFAAFDAGLAV
jgi:CRP-like cAMP-binding protein